MVTAKVKPKDKLDDVNDELVVIPVNKVRASRAKPKVNTEGAPAEIADEQKAKDEAAALKAERVAKRKRDDATYAEDLKTGLAFLPRGTILHHKFSNKTEVLLIELPPGIYPIQTWTPQYGYRNDPLNAESSRFDVAMPWQYFLYRGYDSSYGSGISLSVYWSRHRISNLNDTVTPAKIPDSERGQVCLGNTQGKVHNKSFIEQVTWSIENFYGHSVFTNLHTGGYNWPKDDYKTLAEWQKASEENPFCYLNWKEWQKKSEQTTLRKFFTNPNAGTYY